MNLRFKRDVLNTSGASCFCIIRQNTFIAFMVIIFVRKILSINPWAKERAWLL